MNPSPSIEKCTSWKTAIINRLNGSHVTFEELKSIQTEIGSNLPKFLYRYRSASNANHIDSLLAGEEWMASPTTFNDPYDSAFCLNFEHLEADLRSKNYLSSILKHTGLDSMLEVQAKQQILNSPRPMLLLIDVLTQQGILDGRAGLALKEVGEIGKERILDEMRDATRVCCFSEDVTSTTMWSHYANNHRGFVIEYESASLPKEYNAALFPVTYRESAPTSDEFLRQTSKINPFWRIAAACIKSPDWAYEREWRMITWNTAFPDRSKGSAHPIKMPKPARVLLGAKIDPHDRHLIEHICRSKGIESFVVRREPNRFQIDPFAPN